MTTSCSTSSSVHLPLLVLLAALSAVTAACSDDTEDLGDCGNEEKPDLVGHPDSTMHHALVRVTDSVEGAKVERSAQASFTDHTKVEVDSRPLEMNIGDTTCYGLTGTVTTTCRKGYTDPCIVESLSVSKVEVEGIGGKTQALDKDAATTGRFSKDNLASPAFGPGVVKVKVTGSGAAGSFPSYEMSMEAPAVLQLKCPDVGKPVGNKEFAVCWNAGDPGKGDVIVIDVRTSDPKVTDKVTCLELDDGCHTIQVGILDWLEIKSGETFTVTVTRDRAMVKTIDANRSALFSLLSRVKLTMTR